MKIEHNPYINRYHYSPTDLIRRKEMVDDRREREERNRVEHIERIRDKELEKGRYVDVQA